MFKRSTVSIGIILLAITWILTGGTNISQPRESVASRSTEGSRDEDAKDKNKEGIVDFQIILQGTYSGLKDPLEKVVQSKEDWEEIWKKHVSLLVPQPPLPEIDLESYAIVVIASGEKRTGGYSVELKEVSSQGDDVLVSYKLNEPAPNSFTMQVLTQPFLMVQVLKPKGVVKLMKVR